MRKFVFGLCCMLCGVIGFVGSIIAYTADTNGHVLSTTVFMYQLDTFSLWFLLLFFFGITLSILNIKEIELK